MRVNKHQDGPRIEAGELQPGDKILIDFAPCEVARIEDGEDSCDCYQGQVFIDCSDGRRRMVPTTHRILTDVPENRINT